MKVVVADGEIGDPLLAYVNRSAAASGPATIDLEVEDGNLARAGCRYVEEVAPSRGAIDDRCGPRIPGVGVFRLRAGNQQRRRRAMNRKRAQEVSAGCERNRVAAHRRGCRIDGSLDGGRAGSRLNGEDPGLS